METRNSIVQNLNTFRGKIVHIMANVSGREEPKAQILLLIILGYIVVVLLLLFIHRKLIKRHKRIHENLILLYDTIRYQIAKAQQANPIIQDAKGIKVVIDADHKKYLVNIDAIHQEIRTIEQKLWQKIVADDQRATIMKQTHKKKIILLFAQLIGRVTTLITAGIYKLFR